MTRALAASRVPARFVRQGSIFWLSLQEGDAPRQAEAIDPAAADRYRVLFSALLERGISMAPSAFEVGFLSLAHTQQDVERLADTVGEILGEVST